MTPRKPLAFASNRKIRDNGRMFALTVPLSRAAAAVAVALAVALPGLASAQSAPQQNALARTAKEAATTAWNGAQDVAIYALGLIGVDYRYGGETPESGVDCSGLVRYVFQQVTGVTLPRTSKELSRLGNKVASADLAPGDLVFFNTRRFAFSHVGIYVGDNRFIHAPRRGREVEVATFDKNYWQKHFNGARRLIGVLPEMMPALIAEASAAAPDAGAPAESPAELAAFPDTQP